ncbi:hypothetical protein SDC9_125213 [bioreactor metagenome]|uniref:Uncharacterized protein n=1 Tax=bioreactor metagenome TaxID=1076179 RepID=A0A645CN57_9ZZZZ
MKHYFIILFVASVIFAFNPINAAHKEANDAKKIYLNAQKTDREEVSQINPTNIMVSTYKYDSDGTEYKKFELRNNNKVVSVTIVNESGKYELYPDSKIAIKEPSSIYLDFDDYSIYSMKETSYKGMICYEIRQKIEQTQETFDRYKSYARKIGIKESDIELSNRFYDMYPNLNIYYVGKHDSLIHCIKSYTSNGKLSIEIEYISVKKLSQMDDSIFQVPNDYKVKITKDIQDYSNATFEIAKKQIADKLKSSKSSKSSKDVSVSYFFNKMGVFFLNYGGMIFFWLAVVLVITILVLKIHMKRSNKM